MKHHRHPLRRSHLIGLTAALLVAGPLAAPAHADLPPQEPGVTLRVFDVQTPLSKLCTLKPAQTPNIDKLMPTINWTGADFGIENFFVAQALANLTVSSAGSYTFRLSSDDGSRLSIDDAVVINHDGLHGLTAKEGTAELSAGVHALRIDHFERDGGQDLKLEWRPPGASSFEVVPNSALSTEAGVVRVTAPGTKECEGGGDSPGDGLPLTGVHPTGGPVVALLPMTADDARRYAVPVVEEDLGDGLLRMTGLIEKPEPADAPSAFAAIGGYVITPGVIDELRRQSERWYEHRTGEIYLTDAISAYAAGHAVYGQVISGRWYDTGNPGDYLVAQMASALAHPEHGPLLRRMLCGHEEQ